MTNDRKATPWVWVRLAWVLAGLAMVVTATLIGQPTGLGPIKDFKVPEYYPPPNQNQLKSLLTGSNAVPQEENRMLLKQVRLETFRTNGVTEMLINADSCFLDSAQRVAYSGGPLHLEAAHGQLLLDGTGFCWQQTNSVVIVSNRVHILLKHIAATSKSSGP